MKEITKDLLFYLSLALLIFIFYLFCILPILKVENTVVPSEIIHTGDRL